MGIGIEEIVICRSEDLADVDVHACWEADVDVNALSDPGAAGLPP